MKKILQASLLCLSSVATSQAFSAEMECYIDTQAYDHYTANRCFAMVWGARKATAVFRVSGANKDINTVIWSDKASSCGSSTSTSCSFSIGPFAPHKASATVLYSDGSWEKVSATASFEDGR
jgi:hypothetical protein